MQQFNFPQLLNVRRDSLIEWLEFDNYTRRVVLIKKLLETCHIQQAEGGSWDLSSMNFV